jgi:hypothetical protein
MPPETESPGNWANGESWQPHRAPNEDALSRAIRQSSGRVRRLVDGRDREVGVPRKAAVEPGSRHSWCRDWWGNPSGMDLSGPSKAVPQDIKYRNRPVTRPTFRTDRGTDRAPAAAASRHRRFKILSGTPAATGTAPLGAMATNGQSLNWNRTAQRAGCRADPIRAPSVKIQSDPTIFPTRDNLLS